MPLPPENQDWLRSILACPACLAQSWQETPLDENFGLGLQCLTCGRWYPINQHGVPNLLPADVALALPEPYFGVWALSQARSLKEYQVRSLASTAMRDRPGTAEFTRFIEDADGKAVLDVGAGTDYTPWYVEARQFSAYVALDPLPVERPVPFHRVQAWAEMLPFADASFDAVILGTSLDHFICLESFWMEARRVLKPGGTIYNWGALFPDTAWLKMMPPAPLFMRPLASLAPGLDRRTQVRQHQELWKRQTDIETLDHGYSRFLIDPYHFRHLTFEFFLGLERYGFTLADIELFKFRYHYGNVYAHAFAKIRFKQDVDQKVQGDIRWRLQSMMSTADLHQKIYDLGERSSKAMEKLESGIDHLNDGLKAVEEGLKTVEEGLKESESRLSLSSATWNTRHDERVQSALSQIVSLENHTNGLLKASAHLDQCMKEVLTALSGDRTVWQDVDRKIDITYRRLHDLETRLVELNTQGHQLQQQLQQQLEYQLQQHVQEPLLLLQKAARETDGVLRELSLSWFDRLSRRMRQWWTGRSNQLPQ